ncbi:glycosyltransferase [Bacillus sp. Sa1BUA2]|uniref:Glycosyltransferase n=1 Tax=Bacillus norwichensis TaxID=2762217 RepID=A0ABR8VI24_9BACI|nr:glycosyltransferase [Bacillus norwichensis]
MERVYKSLVDQSDQDFEWIIVDDGSSDNTKSLVDRWIQQKLIKITYYYQNNQGKHIALNKGVNLSQGKLFTCLDSDDWFYNNTVEIIKKTWVSIKDKKNIAGIIGLDTFEDNSIVGTEFPHHLEKANWINLMYEHKVKGDKAYFYELNILREYDFPHIENNKHMPPSYQLYMISKKYDMWLLNQPLKYVEYLDDGITNNIWKNYLIAPDNYAKYRIEIMDLIPDTKRKVINAIHFNSSLILAKKKYRTNGFKNKVLILLTKPFGLLLYFYLMSKVKKEKRNEWKKKDRKV